MKRRRHRKKNWDGHFYVQACPYTQTWLTHNRAFTQRLYHTHMFYIQVLNTQTLLHTETLLHIKPFETQKVFWHTDSFTHKPFYTHLYEQSPFTHKHFYTQTLLHTNAFAHKRFYTQTRLHTNTLAKRRCSGLAAHMILTCLSLGQCYLAILLSNPTHEEVECQWCSSLVSQQPAVLPCYLHLWPFFVLSS